MHIKTTPNGQVEKFPYTTQDLRRDKLPTTFPKDIPDWMLAEYDVYPVTRADRPAHDELTQFLVRDLAPALTDGAWVIGYTVENIPIEDAVRNVRQRREGLIQKTDWMALSDSPDMTESWKEYRQALRDITSQSSFPYSVEWPTKPVS
jgi:hypothetical protein